jgi:BlaI family transcriptional regulator, penicillinase repressor
MMARTGSNYPTELELEILKILWDTSPLPVRDVRARLAEQAGRPLSHSSVITMLNIMVRKGYLRRRKEGKSLLFTPRVERQSVAGGILGDLLSRVFDGSPSAMVLNLIETADLDADEVAELRRLITRKAKEQQE